MGHGIDHSTAHDVATVRHTGDVVQEQIWCVLAQREARTQEALLHLMCAEPRLPPFSVLRRLLLRCERWLERMGALHKAVWWRCALSVLQ